MKEKEIIEKLNIATDNIELPQKPIENVKREMRKRKSENKKPFYMKKAFISVAACAILAVLIIPVSIYFGGAMVPVKSVDPSISYSDPKESVTPYCSGEYFRPDAATNYRIVEKSQIKTEADVLLPCDNGGERDYVYYAEYSDGKLVGIECFCDLEPVLSISPSESGAVAFGDCVSSDGAFPIYLVRKDDDEQKIVLGFELDGWQYVVTFFGDENKAIEFIRTFE